MFQVFPLEFAICFSREKKFCMSRENSIPLGKNPVKTSCFFLSKQLRSGNLPYSYERFKCRNTQVPPTGPYPLPDPTLPHPGPVLGGARPGREGWTPMQAQSSRPAPAQPCPAPATEVFPQYSIFFRDIQSFLLAILTGFLPRHVLHLQPNFFRVAQPCPAPATHFFTQYIFFPRTISKLPRSIMGNNESIITYYRPCNND